MARSSIVLTTFVTTFIAVCATACAATRVFAAVPAHSHAGILLADDDSSKSTAVAPGKSGGTIAGVVTAIDYRSNTMSVDAGSRKVDVMILPSTNIQGPKNGFHTIADIQKGSRVRVLLSQRAGLYTAQIITLR
jgi:hypothetical protein